MRWVFAGLSFAFLVALAVGTVALRAVNVRTRARIEQACIDVEFCRMEVERRSLRGLETPEDLARHWRQAQDRILANSR